MTNNVNTDTPISEKTLGELFSKNLRDTPSIEVDKGNDVWSVSELLVQYLESVTDSIIVLDIDGKPIGTVGGREIIEHLLREQTYSSFYETRVEHIMEPSPLIVTENTKYKDLINCWRERKRAYAILVNSEHSRAVISARKILEVGMRCNTNVSIGDLPKKRNITFNTNDTINSVVISMFENKTRKVLLEHSNKYLNDRLIIETMLEKLKYMMTTKDFLKKSIDIVKLEEAKVISDNLRIHEISKMLYDMEHPSVLCNDDIITPWDICNALLSKEITEYNVE